MAASPVRGVYDTAVDRESAHEMLAARAEAADKSQAPARDPRLDRLDDAYEKQPRARAPRPRAEPRAPAPRRSNRQSTAEAFTKSVARSVGSSVGRAIFRGILGGLTRGR